MLQAANGLDIISEQHIEKDVDWEAVLRQSRAEGVSSLVWQTVRQVEGLKASMPLPVRNEFERDYYTVAVKNSLIFKELALLLPLFEANGVPIIVLKGAVLGGLIYGNLALRPMADVDLLVKADNVKAVNRIMGDIGYFSSDNTSAPKSGYLNSSTYRSLNKHTPCLHIHWHFINSTIPNRVLTTNIPIDHIWRDAETVCLAGVDALVMAPHHFLIHLAEHSVRVTHSLTRLSYLADIIATLKYYGPAFNWNSFEKESRRFKIEALLYPPLAAAVKLCAAPVPRDILTFLGRKKSLICRPLFMALLLNNYRLPGLSYLLHLEAQPTIAGKIRFLFRTLFPPRRMVAIRCGRPGGRIGPVYYYRRLTEILFAIVRIMVRVCGRMWPLSLLHQSR